MSRRSAFNDTFTAVANTLLEVGVTHGSSPAAQIVAGSVTANDVEFLGDTFTLKSLNDGATTVNFSGGTATLTTGDGGTVTMNASGNFTYLPAAGFTGSDVWTYTITDKGLDGIAGNADDLTSTGTVTITVGTQKVWYVDNSYTGANGASDGRSTRPFTSITATNLNGPAGVGDVDGVGDIVFVHRGTGSAYTGGIALEGNQTLHGEGELLQVGGFNLVAAGTAPLLTNVGGTVVALSNAASNVNTLKGITIGDSNIDISGSSFGTLNVTNTVTLNGTGKALDLTTGTISATFAGLTVTSSATEGIKLTGVGGSLTANTGSLAGITGDDIFISGGTANVTLGISDTNTAGHSVNIANKTGGTVALSGAINDTGTGILLSTNTGATINFTGAVIASTGANKAFSATGGGTISVAAASGTNSLTTTNATALEVQNTTIGAGGLTFKTISSNGASTGLLLNNTGASGGLTVTGDAGGTNNGSGGVIQNSTGIGVSLTSTINVSLGYMNITGSGDTGLKGISVAGFTLNRSNITGNGNSTSDEGLQFGEFSGTTVGVTGAVAITNSSISTNAHNNVHFRSTSGTITSLTVTGSTFSNVNDTTGANSFLFEASGTSTVTAATMSGNTFGNNAPQRSLEVQTHDTATISNFTVNSNTFTDSGIHVSFTQDTASNLDFNLTNNNMTGANPLQAVNVFSSSTATGGTITGEISGNIIGNAAVAGSGSTGGPGIRILIQGQTDSTFLINNNTIRQVGFTNGARGMDLQFLGAVATGLGVTSLNDITITNNTVTTDAPGATSPLAAIFLAADNQGSPARVRANITGNTVPATGTFDYPSFDGVAAHNSFL